MDFSEVINKRKSIRKFTEEKVPVHVIDQAIDHALLAPNSSNLQTWDFYHILDQDKRKELIHCCLNQAAARTASELIVITANHTKWQRSLPHLIDFIDQVKAPRAVISYYKSIIPLFYQPGFLGIKGLIKKILCNFKGLKAPVMRGPFSKSELELISVKSAALAAQNFCLSITNQGYASCMMEGFDYKKLKDLLSLNKYDHIVMVIAVGRESEKGTWGPRFRIPKNLVVHKV